MSEFYQWKVFVGPPFKSPSDPSFYDWSQLSSGVSTGFSVKSILDLNLTATATSMTLVDASMFPNKGGAWIAGSAAGQGWEYVTYTTKTGNVLSGLTREPAAKREHNGAHTAPVEVLMWWELKGNDGKFQITRSLSDDWASINWNGSISGVNIPTAAIRNNHIVVIQHRTDPTAFFTNYIVGFLDSPSGKDDYQNYGEWSVRIISSADLLSKIEVPAYKNGDLDMAKNGSAQGSQALVGTCKERASGDFTQANPSFDAESAIDDKNDTLWFAERLVGENNNDPHHNLTDTANVGGLRFSQMYFNPPLGSLPGSRWIELVMLTGNFRGQSIWTATGGVIADFPGNNRCFGWILPAADVANFGRVILCESEEAYTAQNPLSEHDAIFENKEFFQYIRPQGGELWMRLGELNLWQARVRWGDGFSGVQHEDIPSNQGTWSGPTLPVPAACQTLRYIFQPTPLPSNNAGYWQVGTLSHFGYEIHSDQGAPWIKVELPGIGIKLRDDITATSPAVGQKLYTNDASGPSTAGLPESGTLKIGDETFGYSIREKDGVILSSRTNAAIHRKDDEVYIVDPLNGFATDAPPINKIEWFRYGSAVYPRNFELWVSNLIEARTPDQDQWDEDYVNLHNVLNGATSSYTATFTTRRIKHIVFVINEMTVDPARPRINKIKAWADPSQYGSNWLHNGETISQFVNMLLQDAHIPAGAISTSMAASPMPDGETSRGSAWAILSDLMEYTSHRIECKLDSKIEVKPDSTWTSTAFTPVRTWTKASAASIEPVWGNTNGVSQISMKWEMADKSTEGTATYPDVPDILGSVSEIGPYIYSSAATALQAARRRFFQNRYPYTLVVSCAESDPTIAPGEIHRVQWRMNTDMPEINRIYIVTAVDHLVEGGIGATTLTMTEIGREQV